MKSAWTSNLLKRSRVTMILTEVLFLDINNIMHIISLRGWILPVQFLLTYPSPNRFKRCVHDRQIQCTNKFPVKTKFEKINLYMYVCFC